MNKNIILYFLAFLVLGCFSIVNNTVYAGCFRDINDIYKVENLTCTGKCDDLYIKEEFGEEKYYLKNDSNCQHCDSLHIETYVDDFRLHGYTEGSLTFGYIYDKSGTELTRKHLLDNKNLWKENLKYL